MANLFIVDDEPDLLELLEENFRGSPHEVVLTAGTVEGALGKIPEAQQLGVAVAIIDGLRGGGARVAKTLRDAMPGIKIISYSAESQTFGDRNLLKPTPYKAFLQEIDRVLM